MADGKKIVFEGQDNGVFTMMDKLKRKADEMYQGILASAQLVEQTEEGRTKFISSRINALEQENKLLLEQKAILSDLEKIESGRIDLIAPNLPERLNNTSSIQCENLDFLKENGEKTNELLIELIKVVEQQQFINSIAPPLVVPPANTSIPPPLIPPPLIPPPTQPTPPINNSTSQNNNQQQQQNVFRSTLAALGVVEGVKYLGNKVQSIVSSATNAESGETFAADLISSLPFGGIAGGPMRRNIDEEYKVQVAQNKLKGLTGKTPELQDNSIYGYSFSEQVPLQEQIARSTGNKDSLNPRARQSMILEKGLSLDQGTILQMFKDLRHVSNDMDVVENTANVLNLIPGLKDDPTKTQEFLQLQSQIIDQNKGNIESQDRGVITNMMASFSKIGGNIFSDPETMGQVMGSFDQTLKNPGNDFARARNFSILSQLKPGASYFDLLKMESHGLQEPGVLNETLKSLERTTGGGQNSMTALTKQFNIAPDASEQIVNAWSKDPKVFENKTLSDAEKLLNQDNIADTAGNLESLAKKNVSVREKERATIDNAFFEGVSTGLIKVAELTGQNLTKIFKEGIEKVVDTVVDTFINNTPENNNRVVNNATNIPIGHVSTPIIANDLIFRLMLGITNQ